jgi:hypothetical protein
MRNFSKRGNAADKNAWQSTLHHDEDKPRIELLGSRCKLEKYRILTFVARHCSEEVKIL